MSEEKLKFTVLKAFGPQIIKAKIPSIIIDRMNNYAEKVFNDEKKLKELDAGNTLAGNVSQEFLLEEDWVKNSGWLNFLYATSSNAIKVLLKKDIKKSKLFSWFVKRKHYSIKLGKKIL